MRSTEELDRVLATAADELARAIPMADAPQHATRSPAAMPTWPRVAAAAVALVGVGVAAGFALRDGTDRDSGRTPPQIVATEPPVTTPVVPTLPADTPTSAVPTTSPVEPPSSARMVPAGDPVGLAYRIPDAMIPAGYRMVAAYDSGVGEPAGQVPVFHGVAVMLDDRGMPASPAIHVEVQDQPPAMKGTATSVDVNGIAGEYVVWDQQLINAGSSPTADVRWQLPSGKWLIVSGPSLDFILLQVARSAAVDDAGAVAITPPTGFTYLPSWTTFGMSNGAGIVYEGPELGTLTITVQRTDDPIVLSALKGYSASNLVVRDGAPALEYSGSRGLGAVTLEPTPGVRVTVSHSTPQTVRDLNARLPLDRTALDEIIDSLEPIDGASWTALQDQMAVGYERSNPEFPSSAGIGDAEMSLTGPVAVPVTDLLGATERTLPVELTRSIDGYYRLIYSAEGGSINLGAGPDLSAYRGNFDATDPAPVLIEAGRNVDELVMIRATGERIPVTLIEAAPGLIPGTRYGYVDAEGEDVELETTAPDGSITTTPLARL